MVVRRFDPGNSSTTDLALLDAHIVHTGGSNGADEASLRRFNPE